MDDANANPAAEPRVPNGEASRFISWMKVGEVKVPFADPKLLLRLKQTYRDKDALDREYLRELIRKQEEKSK